MEVSALQKINTEILSLIFNSCYKNERM